MMKATMKEKAAVVSLLSHAFEGNKSVNYIVRQDNKRSARLRALMEYSFLTCLDFGKVFLSEDGRCCALVLFPDRKRTSFRPLWRDIKLIFSVTGVCSVFKVLRRESLIKKQYPAGLKMYYIWFIGCDPAFQGRGLGTTMLCLLLSDAQRMNRPVYLETSTERNIPWYQRAGLEIYSTLDFGYPLYCFRKEN
jgi:hypothetical protein